MKTRRRGTEGFTLVELLLVIAIITIVASIMIPNLIDAIHKAKQKRTLAELNGIGTAWMSWLTDQVGAASAGAPKTYNTADFEVVDYEQVFGYLHPSDSFFYMQEIPQKDAWGSRMTYLKNPNLRSDKVLVVCAAARDDIFDTCRPGTELPVGPFLATDFDSDLIWADGTLLRWPSAN